MSQYLKCPCCRKFGEYEWDQEDGPGALVYDGSDFSGSQMWEKYNCLCPHCNSEFNLYEMYRFTHHSTVTLDESHEEIFTEDDCTHAEALVRSLSRNRRRC